MNTSDLYSTLEKEFELIHDNYRYMNKFQTDDEEIAQIARFESILLGMNVDGLVKYWDEDSKNAMLEYCEKRMKETENIHLKVKYGWNLWAITGKSDYRLLNETIDLTLAVLETFLNKDDYDHTSTFCDYFKKVLPYINALGKKKIEQFFGLINRAVNSDNENLKFQIMAMVYYQVQEGYDYLLNSIGAQQLAEIGLKQAKKETELLKQERQLEFAVYFAGRTSNQDIKREANEMMGDYKMSHLYPDDEKNLAIAHLNDHLLIEAMNSYKRAGNREKLKKATLAYEENKPKLRYPRFTNSITVEQRNKEIDAMNNYILDVVKGGTSSIIDALLGNRIDVFMSAEILGHKAKVGGEELLYQTCMGAVNKDSFQNSRHTTHEKNTLHMLADYAYRNTTFHVFALIICNGLKEGTLSFDILKEAMLQRGFARELNKYDADGNTMGSTYFDRIDIGIKEFLRLLPEYIDGKNVDWRYCISFYNH